MPKLNLIQTNFTAGEFSPRMAGRTDYAKYYNSCAKLDNFIIDVQGGLRRRPGLYTVAGGTNPFAPSYPGVCNGRLIPFVFSADQSYVLHFFPYPTDPTVLLIYFYTNHGQMITSPTVPVWYQIGTSTVWIQTELDNMQYLQCGDVLHLFFQSRDNMRIERLGPTNWRIVTPSTGPMYNPPPLQSSITFPDGTCTPSGATGTITLTTDTDCFVAADVSRQVFILGGKVTIKTFTDSKHVTGDVTQQLSDFATSPAEPNTWHLAGTPSVTLTCTGTTSDYSRIGAVTTFSAASNAFRALDVGKYLTIHDGCAKIITVIDAQHIVVEIVAPLTSTTASAAWDLWSSVFDTDGQPSTGTIFDNRLVLGGVPERPLTILGSVSNDWYSFIPGALADQAFDFSLGAHQVDRILWLAAFKSLIAGTASGEWIINGGNEPITPTNVRAVRGTGYGCAAIPAVAFRGCVPVRPGWG